MRMILTVMFLALALTACGEKKEVKDTIFGSQAQMKDKARAVEDKLKEGAEKTREAVKASEQDDGAEQQKGY
ncbi:MAG: hypothetical protein AB1560_11225 [Pseudomonadota bacterium]